MVHESKIFPTYTTRTFTRSGGEVQLILNSALNGGEWSAPRPGPIVPRERALGAHLIGREWAPEPTWVFCGRAISLAPAGTRTPDHPTYSPVTIPTTLSRVPFLYNKLQG